MKTFFKIVGGFIVLVALVFAGGLIRLQEVFLSKNVTVVNQY